MNGRNDLPSLSLYDRKPPLTLQQLADSRLWIREDPNSDYPSLSLPGIHHSRLHPDYEVSVILELTELTTVKVLECLRLLQSQLDGSEVESLKHVKYLTERNPRVDKSTYLISTVLDRDDKVSAMASGSITPTGLFLVGYTVTDPNHLRRGLGTSAYLTLLQAAQYLSIEQFGIPLSFQALEASDGAENFWRKFGFKEIKLIRDGVMTNFTYLQPPLIWDKQTAEPVHPEQFPHSRKIKMQGCEIDFPGKNESLMIQPTDEASEVSREQLLEIVRAFYREYYFIKRAVGAEQLSHYFDYFNALMESYQEELNSVDTIAIV